MSPLAGAAIRDRLRQLLRGDLDWIVMKALEKDRTRRYDTASTFAADVRRYREHLPVEARRASTIYRLRRFARRNRVAFITALLVLTALVLGMAGAIGQLLRARVAEASAQEELDEKSKLVLQLVALRNAEIAERRAAEIERVKAEANFRKARQAVDEYFMLVSESRLFDVPGLQPLRKQLLEAALKYYEDFVNQRGQEPQLRAATASVLLRVAQSDLQNLQPDDGVRALERSLAIIESLSATKLPVPGFPQRLAGFGKGGRFLHSWTDLPTDREAALRALHQAAAIWERFVRENPGVADFKSDLALYYHYIGAIELFTEQPKKAYATFLKASGIWEDLARQLRNAPNIRTVWPTAWNIWRSRSRTPHAASKWRPRSCGLWASGKSWSRIFRRSLNTAPDWPTVCSFSTSRCGLSSGTPTQRKPFGVRSPSRSS